MEARIDGVNVKVGEGIYLRVIAGPMAVETPVMTFAAAAVLAAGLLAGTMDPAIAALVSEKVEDVLEFDPQNLADVGAIILMMIPKG